MSSFEDRSAPALLNSEGSFIDTATNNQMAEAKRLSLPQMPALLEEESISSAKCFWSPRSKSSRRVKSIRSSFFLLKERPKGGVFDLDKLDPPRKTRSPPTRSVNRMVEPFPLILPDKRPTAGDSGGYNQTAPLKLRRIENTHGSRRRLNAPTAAEGSTQHTMSANLCNSPASITYLDMGMFPPETTDLQALYFQLQNEDPVPDCTDCSCSPRGSACEEICIFEDYAGTQENSPHPFVGDPPSKRFSCSPGSNIDAVRAPARIETSAFETEGNWLAGQSDCQSWLEDTSSFGEQERKASQARLVQQKLPRALSWVSDSSDSSPEETEDSFQYATALAPSRPKIVDIPSCTPPSDEVSALTLGSSARASQLYSNSQPISPPSTPVNEQRLGTGSGKTSIWDTSGRIGHSTSQQSSGDPTPPTTPDRINRPLTMMSKGVPRIVSMLEDSARMFPSTMLQLHSTPITLIRKLSSQLLLSPSTIMEPTSLPPAHPVQSGLPVLSTSLSSRPLPAPENLRQNTGIDGAAAGIAIFGQIFSSSSNSTDFLHIALYAHIIALNFLSDLVATPSEQPPVQFPPKALSTLGAIEPIEGQGQLYDQITKVSTALRECVGRLLEACCGRNRLDETLFKALRVIVRLVESRSNVKTSS